MAQLTTVFRDPTVNMMCDLLGDGIGNSENSDGFWVDVSGYDKIALGIIATAAATVEIRGSMSSTPPDDNSYDGFLLFSPTDVPAFSGAGEIIVAIKTPIHWLKVKVTANSGQVNAPLIAV